MKAIRVREFGGPEKLVLEEVPDLRPAQGQVLVEIKAAGVNPVETYIRTGTYAIKPSLPYTPGGDGAGIVLAVGDGVTRWKRDDRVYTGGSVTGTYAQQALCTEAQVHRLPTLVAYEQGAALGVPYATAWRALFQKARMSPGERVLVHGGSGGVGTAAIQLARAAGAEVFATAGSEEGRNHVVVQGAHHALDHSAGDLPDQVAKLTAGRGVDVILEMLANKNLGKDLTMLSRGGRVVVIGSRGPVEINPRDAMGRDGSILSMVLFNTPEPEMAQIHAALVATLETGAARPVVGQEFSLADAPRAHEAVMQPGARGKIVLKP